MPFDREHMLLQWRGAFLAGPTVSTYVPVEEFVGSMRFAASTTAPTGELVAVDNDDALDTLIDDLALFFARPGSAIPARCRLMEIKWNRIDVNGKYASQETRVRDVSQSGFIGALPSIYTPQVAMVSTYLTEASRGRASKGRTYWPTAFALKDGEFVVDPDLVGGFAASVAKLISDWGNWPGLDQVSVKPVVMSSLGAGTTRPITGVAADTRLDVQRRRGADIAGSYVQRPLP